MSDRGMKKEEKKPEPGKSRPRESPAGDGLRLGRRNYLLLSLAVVLICLGYVRLRQGSTTDAPILLVLGYCVAIPLGIVLKP